MNIVILGAGRAGHKLVELLISEHQIVVVDTSAANLIHLQTRYDIRAIEGSASDPVILDLADAKNADLIIAATPSDEINLVACKMCQLRFPTVKKIARIRNKALYELKDLTEDRGFGIDFVFSPEKIVSEIISDSIRLPSCNGIFHFADGKISLAIFHLNRRSTLIGKTIHEITSQISRPFKIIAIYRRKELSAPEESYQIEAHDELFVMSENDGIAEFTELCAEHPPKNILIAGGGNIGFSVAQQLEHDISVKIVEIDQKRCAYIAKYLQRALVIKGQATDDSMLRSEDIENCDYFCGLTSDDEENVMAAILAKRLGAKRVISLINRELYFELFDSQKIDLIISPAKMTLGALLKHMRTGDVHNVHYLGYGSAEAIEAVVHGNEQTSKLVGRELTQISWPDGLFPAGLIRNTKFIADLSNTPIHNQDRLIFLARDRQKVKEAEKLLQVSLSYF